MPLDLPPDISLTCRSPDLPSFLSLGFTVLRDRGAVLDLAVANADRDLWPARCRIAAAGVPFYGRSIVSRDGVPVVFAADGAEHWEAYGASQDRSPGGFVLEAHPRSREVRLALPFYRHLARALSALPDPRPCPLLMPSAGRRVSLPVPQP